MRVPYQLRKLVNNRSTRRADERSGVFRTHSRTCNQFLHKLPAIGRKSIDPSAYVAQLNGPAYSVKWIHYLERKK